MCIIQTSSKGKNFFTKIQQETKGMYHEAVECKKTNFLQSNRTSATTAFANTNKVFPRIGFRTFSINNINLKMCNIFLVDFFFEILNKTSNFCDFWATNTTSLGFGYAAPSHHQLTSVCLISFCIKLIHLCEHLQISFHSDHQHKNKSSNFIDIFSFGYNSHDDRQRRTRTDRGKLK